VNKLLALGFVLLLVLFNTLYTKPKLSERNNSLLFSNPLIVKALSGFSHNLVADHLWLLSNTVSEMNGRGSYDVNASEFSKASYSIAIMDPYFFEANLYGIIFIATITKDYDKALEILRFTRKFDNMNSNLIVNEILLMLNQAIYKKQTPNMKQILLLAKVLSQIPESKKRFGVIDLTTWIDDLFYYYADNSNRKKEAIENILWLYKNTNDLSRKAQIKEKLDALKASKK